MRQALLKGLQAAAPRRMPAKHASRRTCHARAEDAVKEHNHHQQEVFDAKVQYFTAPLPPEITERLARIAAAVPDLAGARVIDVGSGTGCLVSHLQAAGAQDILSVDLSPKMLAELERRFGPAPTLGNSPAVRTWHGDICELPNHMGRARAVFMNGVFGNIYDPHAALLKACMLLLEGGHVVVSHPLGRAWHKGLHEEDPAMVPHELPSRERLDDMVADLPLEVAAFHDEDEFYSAVLRIPDGFRIPNGPLQLQGKVVEGFQRGSKQMGVPTANVAPLSVEAQFEGRPKGVYFGWAQLQGASGEGDGAVHPMVLNYGVRPTIKDGSNVTVEAHILHKYAGDFYGEELKLLVVGFLRPEMQFSGLDDLINRIHTDIGLAQNQLAQQDAREVAPEGWWA